MLWSTRGWLEGASACGEARRNVAYLGLWHKHDGICLATDCSGQWNTNAPTHRFTHTHAPGAFCILMTQPHECNRANKVTIFGQCVGSARRHGWRGPSHSLTHFAFQIKGSVETLETDLGFWSPLILTHKHMFKAAQRERERERERQWKHYREVAPLKWTLFWICK